jgi:hypothetical protein
MSVAFVAGALLGGLALAALPLIIHLISKRRARRVEFAAIELIMRSRKKTARSLRLRQLLLLVLRTLLVAGIAAAVAGPYLHTSEEVEPQDAPLVVVLALDNSASMRATLDGRSGFDRAKRRAREVVSRTADDVRFALLSCEAQVRDVLAAPTFDRGVILAALDALEAGWGRSDLVACTARASELALAPEGQGARRVVVISDLAAHAFVGAPTSRAEGVLLEWLPVWDEEPPPNHGLSDVEVERTAAQGDGVEVRFSVSRFGGPELELPVDLIVDSRRAARVTVPLASGRTERRALSHAFGSADERREAEARVLLPDDALAHDNEVRVPVTLAPPVAVLIVDGAPQPVQFRDEIYYLENALGQRKAGTSRLRLTVVGPDEVVAGRLADARVVVLANVARLEAGAARALVEFVKAGGGLFVTSGDQMEVDWYNTQLAELLPGRLRGAKGQALLDDASVADVLGLAGFFAGHPVFRGLADGREGGLAGLGRVRTHTTMLLEPDASAQRSVIARFTNETPALLERQVAAGRVLLLATSIDRDWSDLAIRPGFLPLVQQIVLYVAGALDEAGEPIVTVDTTRELVLPRGAERLEVRTPEGRRVPLRPAADVERRADGSAVLAFDDVRAPGGYQVFVGFEGGELKELKAQRFTALCDSAESDLRLADDDTLSAAVPKGATATGGGRRDDEVVLWPWLLIGCLLLAATEALVLRRAAV